VNILAGFEIFLEYLMEFFDENPQAVIQDAVDELTSKFSGLEMKKSRVHEFMKNECNLTMKKANFGQKQEIIWRILKIVLTG
jgi:hypothetical protein